MKIFVVPKEGLKLHYPGKRRALLASGEEVESGPYWLRRIAEGDVKLGEKKEPEAKTGGKKTTSEKEVSKTESAAPKKIADKLQEK